MHFRAAPLRCIVAQSCEQGEQGVSLQTRWPRLVGTRVLHFIHFRRAGVAC
jgi:hypothetical protein